MRHGVMEKIQGRRRPFSHTVHIPDLSPDFEKTEAEPIFEMVAVDDDHRSSLPGQAAAIIRSLRNRRRSSVLIFHRYQK